MVAIIAICGTATMLTSCSDNDDNSASNSTPAQKVDEQLYGSWTLDADGMEELDLATLDLRFNKDQTMQFVSNNYIEESDSYYNTTLNATYRAIEPKSINGSTAQALEITYDEDFMKTASGEENFDYDPALSKDTLYYQLEGGKFILKSEGGEEEAPGDIEFAKGATDTTAMDKKPVKEYLELYHQFCDQYTGNTEANEKATTRSSSVLKALTSTGRDMSQWMKDIPDERKVCQLMVPGTHDAATFGLQYGWMLTMGKTQLQNWSDQFNSGIRAFDIRSRQFEGSSYLYHSMLKCNIWFGEALDDFAKILKENPNEGIILLVKGEDNDIQVAKFWQTVLNYLVQVAPINFNFDRIDMEETTKENLRLIDEKLRKPGLLAKYQPGMTMKDLRGKALVWLVNQPGNWDMSNAAYDSLRNYIALEKDNKLYALDGSFAPLSIQNQWECPDNMTEEDFVSEKGGKFETLLKESATKRDSDYWYSNAANAYYKDAFGIPNYVTFAKLGYPSFISSIEKNPGCRGIVLQDYAGQAKLTRVEARKFLALCGVTVFVSTVPNAASGVAKTVVNSLMRLFGSKKRWEHDHVSNALVWATYEAAVLMTASEDTHGQELTNAVVESNFTKGK